MPGKILGLDINEDAIIAVQVLSGLKGYQVTACAQVALNKDGEVEETLKGILEQMELLSDAYVTAIPAERAFFRDLKLPFRAPKKIKQTLPFEMETVVPLPIGDLIVDFLFVDRSDESEILGVCVKKGHIAEYLAPLQAHGIEPEILDIRCVPMVSWLLKQEETPDNGLFLEIGAKRGMMILFLNKHIALIRSLVLDGAAVAQSSPFDTDNQPDHPVFEHIESRLESFCATVLNTIHSFGWQTEREDILPDKVFYTGIGALYSGTGDLLERFLDIPAEQVNVRGDKSVQMESHVARVWNPSLMDNALALALRHDRSGQGFNFRKDEFEVKKRYSGLKIQIRRAAMFLILILAFLMVDLGLDYYLLKNRHDALEQNINEVFRKTFPDVGRIVNPVEQAKVKIREVRDASALLPGTRGSQRQLDLLNEISKLPKSLDIHVTSWVVDQDKVTLSGDTDDYATVDSIENALKASPYFSSVKSPKSNRNDKTGRIEFDMILQRTI
ncbi:MAG: pilus assembly protein PilM [Deltaproteobacteria bacterium]|nr:pilus assembly protein PilM [Deltaproteobacteria bacterium]